LDLDAWINDPPSESEDEAVPTAVRYENNTHNNQSLFSGDSSESYYHGSNLDSYTGDGSGDHKAKNYVEPTTEELDKQREIRKQSQKMNPFYLKESTKAKSIQKVCCCLF